MSALRLVETRGQQAWTTSEVVAEGCELNHQTVLRLVRKYQTDFEELGLLGFEIRPRLTGKHGGGDTEFAILNEDQATYLITLFRNSPIVRRFKLALVKAFRRALEQINRDFANPPRRDLLTAKRVANAPMLAALTEAREEAGKATEAHHYMTEAKLCNGVLTGKYAKLDEKTLSNDDVALLEQIRRRNESYLLAGLGYADRKARLSAYALRQRTRQIADERGRYQVEHMKMAG